MAPSKALVIAVATIALVVQSALAANYTVGAPGGSWDLQTNFASWAASKTFVAGDNLIFTYPPQVHDVLEVTKANYDSCSSGGPIASHTSGNDVIPLPAAATRYFICGIPNHCNPGGMKVAITVAAGAAATPPPASSSPAPPTSPGGSPPAASSPPPSSTPPSPPPPSTPGAGAPASPPPPPQTPGGSSGADGRSGVQTKAAVGLGLGVLVIMLAL